MPKQFSGVTFCRSDHPITARRNTGNLRCTFCIRSAFKRRRRVFFGLISFEGNSCAFNRFARIRVQNPSANGGTTPNRKPVRAGAIVANGYVFWNANLTPIQTSRQPNIEPRRSYRLSEVGTLS
jgi:hypothetical protein